ncbi:MAG: hypothetical protein K0B10_14145 [Vicingaceae bacterium]|nr:hypothetical protein [Vicingaceae bacterium]
MKVFLSEFAEKIIALVGVRQDTIMRNILFISIIFLLSCNKHKINVVNCEKWEINKPIFYNVEYREIKTDKDSVILAKKSIYRVELVVDEKGDSSRITWSIKYETRKPDSLLTNLEKLIGDTIEYKEEYKIIYQTNEVGQYQKIVNWDELDKMITGLWNDYKNTLNVNTTTKKEVLKNIESAFMNRAAIESKLTLAISPLHCVFGLPYSNQTSQTTEIVTGFNNQPLLSNKTHKILSEENDFVVMQVTYEYDSNEVVSQVNDVVRELGSKEVEIAGQIKMTDTCNVGFSKLTNWPYQVEFWRVAKLGDVKKNISVSLVQVKY